MYFQNHRTMKTIQQAMINKSRYLKFWFGIVSIAYLLCSNAAKAQVLGNSGIGEVADGRAWYKPIHLPNPEHFAPRIKQIAPRPVETEYLVHFTISGFGSTVSTAQQNDLHLQKKLKYLLRDQRIVFEQESSELRSIRPVYEHARLACGYSTSKKRSGYQTDSAMTIRLKDMPALEELILREFAPNKIQISSVEYFRV